MTYGHKKFIADGGSFFEFLLASAQYVGSGLRFDKEKNEVVTLGPNTHYRTAHKYAAKELKEFLLLNNEELVKLKEAEYVTKINSWNLVYSEAKELEKKYTAALKKACAWEPPSALHEEVKTLMINVLVAAIDNDCVNLVKKPRNTSFKVWRDERLRILKRDVKFYKNKAEHEKFQALQSARWDKAFLESIEHYKKTKT